MEWAININLDLHKYINAQLTLTNFDNKKITLQRIIGEGLSSSQTSTLFFGLGKKSSPKKLNLVLTNGESIDIDVIEINGAGSEPTNIYDPKHSIFFAWKELTRHWKLMYQISAINFRKGHPLLSFSEGREMIKAGRALEAELRLF